MIQLSKLYHLIKSSSSFPTWSNFASIIIVIIIAVAVITMLHRQENQSRQREMLLARMNSFVSQLSSYEWEAVAQQTATPEVRSRIKALRNQADDLLRAFQAAGLADADVQQIFALYQRYNSVMDEELRFFAQGDAQQATLIDAETVEPAFTQLADLLNQRYLDATQNAVQTNTFVDISSLLLGLLMIVALTLFFRRMQRARYSAKFAIVQHTISAKAKIELEDQVQKRTEELLKSNAALQQEIQQRQQVQQALHSIKEELEIRVVERTTALKVANDRLELELNESKQIEAQITASLQEKEILLKEVHHRVKNNLQVISSLLYLQSDKIKDQQALEIFRDSQNRVRSMALIHEKLYQAKDLTKVDLAGYIHSLVGYLLRSYGIHAATVRIQVRADDVWLGIDTAMPCGLILNELVANALKHAFPSGRTGNIQIELRAEALQGFSLYISDDGIGFPGEIDFQNTASLGLQLVNTLVNQLDGTIELQRNGGTAFKIKFKAVK